MCTLVIGEDGLNAIVLNGAFGFLAIDADVRWTLYRCCIVGRNLFFYVITKGIPSALRQAVEQFNLQEKRQAAEALLQRLQEIVDPP